jgi:hypothetical protein
VLDFEEAAAQLGEEPADENFEPWTPDRLKALMDGYRADHGSFRLDPEGRNARHTYVLPAEDKRTWRIQQMLVDLDETNDWVAEFEADLEASRAAGAPVLRLIGPASGAPLHDLAGRLDEEGAPAHSMRGRITVDPGQGSLGGRDVHPDHRLLRWDFDKDGHGPTVGRIRQEGFFQRHGVGQAIPILEEPLNVKGEGFLGHDAGLVQRAACGEAPRKIREGDGKITVRVLVDECDVITHGGYSIGLFNPACLRMLFSVPFLRSFLGWGTVTRPGLVGCLN